MATLENVTEWRGREMFDRDGEKIGTIDSVYLDQQTGRAEWALVHTGLFGMRSTWVPIGDAVAEPNGVRVPVEKAAVKRAPSMDPDSDMSREEEAQLFRYYGRDYDDAPAEARGRDRHGERAAEHHGDGSEAALDRGARSEREHHRDEHSPEHQRAEREASLEERAPGRHPEEGQRPSPDAETHGAGSAGQHRWPLAHETRPSEAAGHEERAPEHGREEPRGPSPAAGLGHTEPRPDHQRAERTTPAGDQPPKSPEQHREDRAHREEGDGARAERVPRAEADRVEEREPHREPRSPEDRGNPPDEQGGSGRHPSFERGVDRLATRLKRMI